ncbi:peptigoglycan-binding protein LysM [Psychrobacter pacificensis]|uniref:FimV/HubP-related protein n=1 Tax=Psychrobacter pacificensis TaxID=112002 RepID=UPI001CBDF7AB|nr:peptigoglycan-binding protein LysM [Psychrobacter pacificensis]MBZ1393308.1 peptigoglycan-binding protein LysM [Psychrobacter pacificensis]MDE0843255.1 peptigoglycan-binding protein LysM [Psychrobacter pacificensis]
MSCHLSRRLTTVHRAVSMALFCSVGCAVLVPSVQAATIGKTVVTSAQHEPLVASIVVSNIQSADFSASLANSTIYQQMGLTPTDSMTVRFQPTSATSGQVFITTSQPVSKPFADVVLAINDNGRQNMVPKTLLMPLKDSVPINTGKNIATGAKKPNLPSVSVSNAMPLTVRKGAPPPLMSAPAISSPKLSKPSKPATELLASTSPAPNIQAPTVTATSQVNSLTYTPSRLNNGRLNSNADIKNNTGHSTAIGNSQSSVNTSDNSALSVASSSGTMTTDDKGGTEARAHNNVVAADKPSTDKQLDILNIQVTRQIQPSSKADSDLMASSPVKATTTKARDNSKSAIDSDNRVIAAAQGSNIPDNTALPPPAKVPSRSMSTGNETTNHATTQYQVQRNDSLWMIAQQIARENNLDTSTVMKQIQSQNPDAFINQDADQLKADAKLRLPSYDVIPSQQSLEAAISAQRQYSRIANTPVVKKSAQTAPKKSSETVKAASVPKKPTTTKTQKLPQAQFSVLAPGHDGNADGTQAKSAADKGNGLSTDILATLKASRQETASQAQRLSKTSSALDNYTKKLQLQNQKLAELQARLKKLRNQ